jgi:hypothetical protein
MKGRPRKPIEQHKLEGTYRKDRDPAKIKLDTESDKYEVIRKKLAEVENLIKETPVDGNEKKLIELSNLYQKLISILRTPSLEEKRETIVDGLWKN